MAAHSDQCHTCRNSEQAERVLRNRFADAPVASLSADLWPQIAQQLTPISTGKPRWAFSRRMLFAPAFSLAMAAGALFWFTHRPLPTESFPQKTEQTASANRVATMVNDIRNIGVPESELLIEETHTYRQMGVAVAAEGGSL